MQELQKSFASLKQQYSIGVNNQKTKKWSKIDVVVLKNDIEKYPDSYCYERAKRLVCSQTGIRDAMYRLGVSYKKTLNHPKVDPERRSTFCQKIKDLEKACRPIVYIDESGFAHALCQGPSIKGQRCYGKHD